MSTQPVAERGCDDCEMYRDELIELADTLRDVQSDLADTYETLESARRVMFEVRLLHQPEFTDGPCPVCHKHWPCRTIRTLLGGPASVPVTT